MRGNRLSFSMVDGVRLRRCDTTGSSQTLRALVRK